MLCFACSLAIINAVCNPRCISTSDRPVQPSFQKVHSSSKYLACRLEYAFLFHVTKTDITTNKSAMSVLPSPQDHHPIRIRKRNPAIQN